MSTVLIVLNSLAIVYFLSLFIRKYKNDKKDAAVGIVGLVIIIVGLSRVTISIDVFKNFFFSAQPDSLTNYDVLRFIGESIFICLPIVALVLLLFNLVIQYGIYKENQYQKKMS